MNKLILPNMLALQWLIPLIHGIWNDEEKKSVSNSAVRRWIDQGALQVNGEKVLSKEVVDFPVFSVVLFPKSDKKRITIW